MYTKEFVAQKIKENDQWLIRGVLAIYERQTDEEQQTRETTENNGVGFNGVDSTILSSFAEQIKQWENNTARRFPKPLSDKQLAIARKKMVKYAKQLANIANNNRVASQQREQVSDTVELQATMQQDDDYDA